MGEGNKPKACLPVSENVQYLIAESTAYFLNGYTPPHQKGRLKLFFQTAFFQTSIMRRHLIARAVARLGAAAFILLHALIKQPQLRLLQIQRLLHFGDCVIQAAD